MKKRLLLLGLVAVLAISAFALLGCDSEEDQNTIVVATDPTYPPFESMVGGEKVGFDIDLAKAIADHMGADIEFVALGWDALLTALSSDSQEFDFAASAMTIRQDRIDSGILFSNPYFVSVQALSVPADSDITSMDDIGEGFRVAVQNGTTGHIFADNNLAAKGVVIRPYEGGQECYLALASDEVDGVIIDIPVALNQAEEGDFPLRTIPIPAAEAEYFGLAMGASRTDMADAINEALAALIADGTYAEIYARWIDADNPPVLPPATWPGAND
jgi:arginine/lysine/histidine/glutamine transport system substrate-binding/permease protein